MKRLLLLSILIAIALIAEGQAITGNFDWVKFFAGFERDYYSSQGIYCTEVEETAVLLQKLDSENHIVLISPHRLGKSSLVHVDIEERAVIDPYLEGLYAPSPFDPSSTPRR